MCFRAEETLPGGVRVELGVSEVLAAFVTTVAWGRRLAFRPIDLCAVAAASSICRPFRSGPVSTLSAAAFPTTDPYHGRSVPCAGPGAATSPPSPPLLVASRIRLRPEP